MSAIILNENPSGAAVAASSARISTQGGTALEVFDHAGDREKDARLIGKVLSSGHKSVIEHHVLSIAFNDVSVFVEQFVIEARLASFTVKSRRYVDFSDAGYYVPEDLPDGCLSLYRDHMDQCFRDYQRLLELGIPREDARFVLPYALHSNFYATMNARELIQLICSMTVGRGRHYPELVSLGNELKEQFDRMYPGLLDRELGNYAAPAEREGFGLPMRAWPRQPEVKLTGGPADSNGLLLQALSFSGRFGQGTVDRISDELVRRLMRDSRPRELEFLNYTFRIGNISLACLTHFTRHRMQSPLIPDVIYALSSGGCVLPETVAANAEARSVYDWAFERQYGVLDAIRVMGAPASVYPYFANSGNTIDMMVSYNARELLHFARLRTCSRAQWEIRVVARQMMRELCGASMELFGCYGPSCAVTGSCPEGRMTCGHPVVVEKGIWKERV
ncbi:MAG: FAD-dependent thymidylate synthase [Clostridia bacterium]|nr:FAD-dependent thymidylate synthase [Clostridia bacterium]